MKETLVIVAHPDLERSTVNRYWVNTLMQYNEQVTVHDLYNSYPSGKIDIKFEQDLLENHRHLIMQFPIYWFNCPPLLKQWLDEVLTYGWAYGTGGDKLRNKHVALAVSAGIKEKDYGNDGRYNLTLKEILKPFELTINYTNANYQSIFAFYGASNEPEAGYEITSEEVEQSAKDYIFWMQSLKMLQLK